jgi:hypothetical protein
VHGCFWHGHDCHLFKWPSTRLNGGGRRSKAIAPVMPRSTLG